MPKQKLISWNVNGLRAVLKKGFLDFIEQTQADIICLQETKISDDLVSGFSFKNYPYTFWNCAEKKGYSGTALFTKKAPLATTYGIGIEKHDKEGRVITAEFENFYIVTVYTPNSQNHDDTKRPRRLDYRTLEWDVDFLKYLKCLETQKPVIFCGDLNVAHTEIDLANPKTNRKNAGFTDEERERFEILLATGFVDTFRAQHPEARDRYSWWSYRAGARKRNIGWRIDYFCVSNAIYSKVANAEILDGVLGSDHCPVLLDIDL